VVWPGHGRGDVKSQQIKPRCQRCGIWINCAGVAALTGYALYQDDPKNYKLQNMLMDEAPKAKLDPRELEIGLGDLKIDASLSKQEAYEVPVKELPEKLKGKVGKQYLIKYQSKNATSKMERRPSTFLLLTFMNTLMATVPMPLKEKPLKNKKSSSEPMMGEFIVPLVDGLSILLIKVVELLGHAG